MVGGFLSPPLPPSPSNYHKGDYGVTSEITPLYNALIPRSSFSINKFATAITANGVETEYHQPVPIKF